MRGAIVGAASFDAGAMILAGMPPREDGIDLATRPRIAALLETCRSRHGHLSFLERYGPLHRYLSEGFAPDLRDTA